MTEPDDQRWLPDLQAGRREACAEMVRRHYEAVYRFLAHLTRDIHQAEDLTQETFAVAWEKIATFQGRSALRTWLHRIAYTKFIDAQRAQRRADALRERIPSMEASSADPLDSLMADEAEQHLYRRLHELDASQRSLLVLHYLQGMSYREMAVILDEPAGTLKWRTAEALKILRALLGDEVKDHAPPEASGPGSIA